MPHGGWAQPQLLLGVLCFAGQEGCGARRALCWEHWSKGLCAEAWKHCQRTVAVISVPSLSGWAEIEAFVELEILVP